MSQPHSPLARRRKIPHGGGVPADPASLPREAPWMAGIRAARANVVPGLMVQGVMLAMLLAYYGHPPSTRWLNHLAEVKAHWGYGYSALSGMVAGGLLPEIIRVIVFQKGKWRRANTGNLFFAMAFWSVMGMIVDGFYRLQTVWFGQDPTVAVVVKKVLVDQFLYNPIVAGPLTAVLYDLKNRGFRLRGASEFFTPRYYREVIVPTLFANWGVWIPVVSILYSLPTSLQIPLLGLALSLWVMLYSWMSEQRSAAFQAA